MSTKLPYLCLTTLCSLFFHEAAFSGQYNDNKLYKKLHERIKNTSNISEFEEAKISFDQNYTDNEIEVVIKANGDDVALKNIWIFFPNENLMHKFVSQKNEHNIGLRKIVVETPDFEEKSIVFAAYPEGPYSFIARSFDGDWLYGTDYLFHELPGPAVITFPIDGSTVTRDDLQITWISTGAESYVVELENEETDQEFIVEISGEESSFKAPEEWIVPGIEYDINIGVVNEFGNITFTEQSVNITEE